MSRQLPERASLDFLKKRAKEYLLELRKRDPGARLATAQLAIARDYGFPSWRALKSEVDRRRAPVTTGFFEACRTGDVATLRKLVARDPGLVHARHESGATGLHAAVAHPEAVKVLLEHGADPNAREAGDNASPLHFAVRSGVEVVRALLDAGADVHGHGDAHELDVIGWACCFDTPDPGVVTLLLQRGARHHIYSAIACKDLQAIRRVVREDPGALRRRLSKTENRQTPVHYVITPPDGLVGGRFRTGDHYAMLDLLIELGADLEAEDDRGRTPLAVAMLRGDEPAMRRLKAAGARVPAPPATGDFRQRMNDLARSVKGITPMLAVPNVRATVEWYRSIGFELEGEHSIDTNEAWAGIHLGNAYLMFVPGKALTPEHGVSLWLYTDRIDDLYQALRDRQLERSNAILTGRTPDIPEVKFTSDIYDTFYGQREFSIADINGYAVNFAQPVGTK